MTIHRLKNPGEELTLEIQTATIEAGQFGEQVKFVDAGGDILYVPLKSVVRQLDRCGVSDIPELDGRSVHFSRSAVDSKGISYWNLDKANSGDTVPAKSNGAPKPAVAAKQQESPSVGRLPGDDDTAFDAIVNRYGECLRTVQTEIAPTLVKAGYTVTTENLLSAAAVLMIERSKRGA